jgi:hypothetical protein
MESTIYRNLIFGIQDASITTIGFLVGARAASMKKKVVVKAGLITVLVSSFSMAIGSYQSERSSGTKDRGSMAAGAGVMLLSYLLTGCVILQTFRFSWLAPAIAVSLALLGTAAFVISDDKVPETAETLALGLLGVALGYLAGKVAK